MCCYGVYRRLQLSIGSRIAIDRDQGSSPRICPDNSFWLNANSIPRTTKTTKTTTSRSVLWSSLFGYILHRLSLQSQELHIADTKMSPSTATSGISEGVDLGWMQFHRGVLTQTIGSFWRLQMTKIPCSNVANSL